MGSDLNPQPSIMDRGVLPLLLLLLLLPSFPPSHAQSSSETRVPSSLGPINLLRPLTGSSDHQVAGVSCVSWRLGVETNNVRNWKTVPSECEDYIGHYMLGSLYRRDSKVAVDQAVDFADGVKLRGDGKEIWIFDIDETTLSNLPYYAHHGFGAQPFNSTLFDGWVDEGMAPPLPESLRLYMTLQGLGIKPLFLTGRTENHRNATISNLKRAGYSSWEKLLLKGEDVKRSSMAFKSGERRKLVEEGGYTIIGNIGDQWSDILGFPEGGRTFKLPDPMYYLS